MLSFFLPKLIAMTLVQLYLKPSMHYMQLLPTGSEEREELGVGSIPVAILPSHQDMKTIAL